MCCAPAKTVAPQLDVHLSTQANCTNARAVEFWRDAGVTRVVAARECPLPDLKEMAAVENCELEIFVHGSHVHGLFGTLSVKQLAGGTGRQQGRVRSGLPLGVAGDGDGAKPPRQARPCGGGRQRDLSVHAGICACCLFLGQALETGAASFKIEGRMKSAHYVGTVVNAYSRALNAYFDGSFDKELTDSLLNELKKTSHRDFTSGFLFGRNGDKTENLVTSKAVADSGFAASVAGWEKGVATVQMRNRFGEGDTLEILSANDSFGKTITIKNMTDLSGAHVADAKIVQQTLKIPCPYPLEKFDILRKL